MANPTTVSTAQAAASVQSGIAAGKTVINDGVIAKVAGIAARDVAGVYDLGGGAARALGAIRDAISNTDLTQGISIEVGETQVAVDVTIVAEYPKALQKVADDVRAAVTTAVETIVGMQVTEVNVTINDVHIPSVDNTPQPEARVQ